LVDVLVALVFAGLAPLVVDAMRDAVARDATVHLGMPDMRSVVGRCRT